MNPSNFSTSHFSTPNFSIVKLLIVKDWQLFQKQLAAYLLGAIFALCLLGMGKGWSFYMGSLVLMILLIMGSCYAISTSVVSERKDQTMPFIMSLPVSPTDFYLAKILSNLATFLPAFVLVFVGTVSVLLFTAVPDGLLVLSILVITQIFLGFCISLSVAMAVESEGWITFVMISSMLLVNPLIMGISRIPAIADYYRTQEIVWSLPAVSILSAQIAASILVLGATVWVHCRKQTLL